MGVGGATLRRAGLGLLLILGVVACDPPGTWQTTTNPSPVRAVHAALMHNGKVLLVAGSGNDPTAFAAGTFKTTIWDPVTGSFEPVSTPWDAFCAGQAFLPDGKLLIAGGNGAYPGPATHNENAGLKKAFVLDPATKSFSPVPDMALARWYPTVTELGDGRLFTVAGNDENGVRTHASQIFNGTSWTPLAEPPAAMNFMPMYPALHLLRDGRLFYSGANVFGPGSATPGIWNLTTNAFQPVAGLTDANRRDQSMSVLLPPAQDQKVMVIGGGATDVNVPAVASTSIVDLSQPSPAYTAGPPIDTAKMYVSAVILPDSTVLQTGGGGTSINFGNHPVFSSQIFDPATGVWTAVAKHTVPRVYHSSALLLPDGRVATFGGNPQSSFETRIEIFTPPYLKGTTARPAITQAPTEIHYGGSAAVRTTQASAIRSAVLVKPEAVTHSSDGNQRLIKLAFTPTATGLTAQIPNEPNLAPPGWYMMFVVDTSGVPSVAAWVHLT